MPTQEELVTRLMDAISEKVVADLRESISRTVEREIQKNITQALAEGELFRRLNFELHGGLKTIYQEIAQAKRSDSPAAPEGSQAQAGQLLGEASDQLDEILKSTESATEEIMDIVEKHMDRQAEASARLSQLSASHPGDTDLESLTAANDELGADLMRLMTALSFQDLTGQRIKRIIDALKKIEEITFQLYMTTGLSLKAQEKNPGRDPAEIEADSKRAISILHGPQAEGASQNDVDDLLSQLGL
jgi:chemotaxis protein CheZ